MINLPAAKKSSGKKKEPCMYLVFSGMEMERLETLKRAFNCSNGSLATFALECMEKFIQDSMKEPE